MANENGFVKQKIKGSYEETKGALMEEWGKLTGDKRVQIKGGLSKAKGKYLKEMAEIGESVEEKLEEFDVDVRRQDDAVKNEEKLTVEDPQER